MFNMIKLTVKKLPFLSSFGNKIRCDSQNLNFTVNGWAGPIAAWLYTGWQWLRQAILASSRRVA